jgi:hypothetical protein
LGAGGYLTESRERVECSSKLAILSGLEQGEVGGLEIVDRAVVLVGDDDVDEHEAGVGAEGGNWGVGLRRLGAERAG